MIHRFVVDRTKSPTVGMNLDYLTLQTHRGWKREFGLNQEAGIKPETANRCVCDNGFISTTTDKSITASDP